jgi:hypothetical protein
MRCYWEGIMTKKEPDTPKQEKNEKTPAPKSIKELLEARLQVHFPSH